MTDEKKDGEITEPVEEKKNEIEDKVEEKSADRKIEAKEPEKQVEVEKEVKKETEPTVEANVKEAAPEEEKKEEEKQAASEDKVETESDKSKKKKNRMDIGNLNFYPELRTDLPEIKPGDVLKMFYRVVEGGKERIQIFEGTVIAIKNSGIAKTITVRKTSFGISIERIFPLNSKLVQKIEVIKHSRVRRAKLYYLRKLKGKAARLKELR